MIGTGVYVTVYGTLSENGVYTGYAELNTLKNKTVYIITNRTHLPETLYGTVIATTGSPADGGKLIVAPRGEVFYEPQIKERLKKVKSLNTDKLLCLYEKSCGAVVFHRSKSGIKVLLLKNHNGKYWSFPKGHIERKETEKQTALREIKEETGLDVKIYDDYRQISDYSPFGKVRKRVVFFLAEAKSDNVIMQEDEIDSFIWVSFPQAEKMCTYENDIRILKNAEEYIKNNLSE